MIDDPHQEDPLKAPAHPPATSPPSNVIPLRTPALHEPRRAARPRWVFSKDAFPDPDLAWLGTAPAFTVIGLQMGPDTDINTLLQAVPAPGVEPNKYDVGEIMADMQYVVGSSAAMPSAPSCSSVHEEVERAIADYESLLFSVADTATSPSPDAPPSTTTPEDPP